jgi:hypothetical protein
MTTQLPRSLAELRWQMHATAPPTQHHRLQPCPAMWRDKFVDLGAIKLPRRAWTALWALGWHTREHIIQGDPMRLLQRPSIGPATLGEIARARHRFLEDGQPG